MLKFIGWPYRFLLSKAVVDLGIAVASLLYIKKVTLKIRVRVQPDLQIRQINADRCAFSFSFASIAAQALFSSI